MIEWHRIENIRVFFHHFSVAVLRRFKQEPFCIHRHFVKRRFSDDPAKSLSLMRPAIKLIQIIDIDIQNQRIGHRFC